jgi:hypothetical protein
VKRRLLAAILIISLTLAALAWVDNRILLGNPTELDAHVRLLLARVFPDYSPRMGHIEVDFPSHVVITDLALNERGSGRTLIKAEHVEANLSLTDWFQPRNVSIRGVRLNVRRGKDGKLNFDVPDSEPAPSGAPQPARALSSPVAISVEDARLIFDNEEVGSRALLQLLDAAVTVYPDGRVAGQGHASVGAVVSATSPLAAGGTRDFLEETETGVLFRPVLPRITFEIDRRESGWTRIPVEIEQAAVGPVLRTLLPLRYIQEAIWDELDPTGLASARVTIRVSPQGNVRPEVLVQAKNATLKLRGFPYPIHDISGRFEIAPGVVSWEDVTARLDGEGRVTRARGSVFIGEATEKTTVFCYVEAQDVPFNETLTNAMPPDIRTVYDQFLVKGVSGPAKVVVFKAPFQEDPQISIRTEVDGRQSAAFVDYPVRLTAEKGTFALREGGNVEIDAEGSLELGGRAHVEARVVHGDLMSVRVHGSDVPVTPTTTERLEPEVRRMVEPFRATAGKADFDVIVTKNDARERPVPRVIVDLHDLAIAPEIFPLALAASGRLEITPSWRKGAPPDERPHVQVDLDLDARAKEVSAAHVSGTVALDANRSADWSGELSAKCERLDLDNDVKRALPGDLGRIFENLAPKGSLKNAQAHIRSTHDFEVTGEGLDLTAALSAFPYRSSIDRFSLARDGRTVALRRVEGRTPGPGRFSLQGTLELPPDEASPPANGNGHGLSQSREPFVSVAIDAQGVALDRSLVAALPEDARGPLEKLDPSAGRLDAHLAVVVAPPLPLELRGDVALSGGSVWLHRLDPNLAGLEDAPVEDVTGKLELDGDRLTIAGLKARFRGAPVVVGGSVALGARASGDDAVGSVASTSNLDLVAHLDGLYLDEKTRSLARGSAQRVLDRFPVEGPCDLDFRIRRGGAPGDSLDLRISPRGIKVVPKIAPLPFEDVRGTIDVSGEEVTLVDLTGRMGKATLQVSRDKRHEAFAPPGTSIYRLRAQNVLPMELADRGPEDLAKVIRDYDVRGTLDVSIDVAVPPDDRARSRFLAEIHTQDLAVKVTSWLVFEKSVGKLQVAGSVAKFEPLDLEGSLTLDSTSPFKQDLRDARIPVRLRQGVLSIGTPESPFTATLYGGNLRGRVESNLKTTTYEGYLYLDGTPPQEGASLGEAVNELARMKADAGPGPKKGGVGTPIHGDLIMSLTFFGGGTDPNGRPLGIRSGEAAVSATKANLIEIGALGTLLGVVKGESGFDPKTFDRIRAELRLKSTHAALSVVKLDSDTLSLAGKDGRLDWDGTIDLDLLPFKTGGGILDAIAKQVVGVNVRGKVFDPKVSVLPFSNAYDRMVRAIKSVVWPEDEPPK